MTTVIDVLNPLPLALAHYERAFIDTQQRDAPARLLSQPVPSAELGVVSTPRKAVAAARHLRALRTRTRPWIGLWPALGHLEPLGTARRTPAAVVFHDPEPIREQLGYGRRSIAAGVAWARRSGMVAVAHSHAARKRLIEFGYPAVLFMPHPIAPTGRERSLTHDVVRVLGQYKPTRDTEMLATLGMRLRDLGLATEIVGRGWPDVPGWTVRSTFVSEDELDALIATSATVLVPYRRFWQSGIAIRAVEHGVPVAGRSGGFLSELLGASYPGLVGEGVGVEGWLAAIDHARALRPSDISAIAAGYGRQARAGLDELVDVLMRA